MTRRLVRIGIETVKTESELELILLHRCDVRGLPTPETQVQLITGRRYRYDLVWPQYKVAVEAQGGVYSGGRHLRGQGFESDAEKSALAQIAGYIVLSITPGMLRTSLGMWLIEQALISRGWRRAA